MVKVENLNKSYGDKVVFNNFNISFEDKKVTAILGNSGVGKTTLLNVIARLIDFEGDVSMTETGVSFAFQSSRLIETLSVLKNVEYVLTTDFKDKKKRREVALESLKNAEILHLKDNLPKTLSGGEKQRVSLARALAKPSELLILDEPFSSLDISLKMRLMNLYINYLEKNPKTVIFVTHDPFEALTFADNVVVLKEKGFCEFKILAKKINRDLESSEISNIRKEIYNAILV